LAREANTQLWARNGRVQLQVLDKSARAIHAKPNPSNAGTEHLVQAFGDNHKTIIVNSPAGTKDASAFRLAEFLVVPEYLIISQNEMRALRRFVNLNDDATFIGALEQCSRTSLWHRVPFGIAVKNSTTLGNNS
jgi:hypothetical protein